ncbi:hypothetical protein CYY_006185 [Polysphondylium violaceum]|uniref:OPA3-like protein n=1 Tax=Polysphondylium violaceum TaxID=133409 RepID=A0A8J4PQY0_9MYCE|nr:hypothetical protein CYY_006185 [Polysphondylium violaceum]
MVLPLLKVGSLVIKSLAKPFSKQIKFAAAKSPIFHANIISMARLWYKVDLKLSKFSGDTTRKPLELNVNAAIDLGAEMLSEAFLLAVALSLLVLENKRSSAKDQKKEEALAQKFTDLENIIENQNASIKELQDALNAVNPNLHLTLHFNDKNNPSKSTTSTLSNIPLQLQTANNNNNNNPANTSPNSIKI